MASRTLRERMAEAARAAELMSDTGAVLSLAVEAMTEACPHGLALAFTRNANGGIGSSAVARDGELLRRDAVRRPTRPIPWIVDLDQVPLWQQNCWVEPIAAGVHGKDYFVHTNPLPMVAGGFRQPPEYGRIMLCRHGRMLSWLGVYVDARCGFRDQERLALAQVAAELAAPLRLAASIENAPAPIRLSPRQTEIMVRLSRGMTNKQIARDLDISPATVKTFLERLLRLSKADNRTALAEWWRRGGSPVSGKSCEQTKKW